MLVMSLNAHLAALMMALTPDAMLLQLVSWYDNEWCAPFVGGTLILFLLAHATCVPQHAVLAFMLKPTRARALAAGATATEWWIWCVHPFRVLIVMARHGCCRL